MIRQPIISVMGHVDHGKTTLLDKIRNTAIASREVGGITQHIGASEVPIGVIDAICGPLLKAANVKVTIPGLLFVDTPGHEAFTNLRRRGGSVADIALLVVDVMKGFEPQTKEAIEILKEYKTPFIVAANKVDLITGWRPTGSKSITAALAKQNESVSTTLETKLYELMGNLSMFGLNSELFSRVSDFQKELAIVPLSAKTGEGIAELLMVMTGLAQRYLEDSLAIEVKGPGKGSILERKEIKGLGITIDVILYDGTLHVNDTIAFATPNSIATSKIRALMKPKMLQQTDEKSGKFEYVDSVSAASGVKISGTGLDDAMPGSPVVQVIGDDYASQIGAEIGDVFKTDKVGAVLKADSIGSIEAISRLVTSAGFGISKKAIGRVTKRDVMDAFAMNASDPSSAVILAFNVGMEEEAEEAARTSGVKVIGGNIIYKLLDDYKEFSDARKKSAAQKIEEHITMPGSFEVLPNAIFRVSHPAIFGVEVRSGRIKPGYRIMNESGEYIGKIKGIQNEKAPVPMAVKGEQFAVSMDEPTIGRQLREGQTVYTDMTEKDIEFLSGDFANLINEEEKELMGRIKEIKRNARYKTPY